MAAPATSSPITAEATSASRSVLRAARFNPLATVGLCFITIFVFFALLAPWIAPYDPAFIDLPHRLVPPSAQHWFGTDELGRDILSRIIFGARISMLVGASVVAGSLALGLIIGSLAGYYGGRIDRFVNVIVMNAFLSFPGFLLAIAFVAFVGPGIFNLILALVIGGWVGYARLVRAQVLAVREREFVEAARALGASDVRILTRHILPNMIQPVIVQGAIGMAGRDSGRSDDELSRTRSSTADGKLGIDAQRWAFASVRCAAPGVVPGDGCDAGCAFLQLPRRRAARLSRSASAY